MTITDAAQEKEANEVNAWEGQAMKLKSISFVWIARQLTNNISIFLCEFCVCIAEGCRDIVLEH